MSTADASQPIAQGDLAKTPFAHLVLFLHRQALTGTLVLTRGGFETKILFRNGRAVAARPLPRGTALQSGLLELCGLDSAAYAFWEGDLLSEASGVIQGTVDPFMFVSESLRGHARESVVASVVDRYRGVQLRATPEADPKRLGIRGAEARALERLRDYAATPEEFYSRVEMPVEDARRLLYLFLITRHAAPEGSELPSASGVRPAVEPDGPVRVSSMPPPGAPAPNTSSRPPNQTTSAGGTAPALRGGASNPPVGTSQRPASSPTNPRITPQPFSQPPSTPPKTTSSQPSPATSSRPPVSRASLPAWQQLASMRAASRSTPAMPVVVPSLPPPVESLDAEGKLRRAEKFVERRSYDEASRIVDDLITQDALNADYHAMRAWIQYQLFTGNSPPQKLLEPIERALRCNEQHPRALYIKGLVLKRMGKEPEAMRFFQRTIDSDPRHIEAQRELRLAKMRRDR